MDVLVSKVGASTNYEYDALGRLTSVCEVSAQAGFGACGQASPETGFLTSYTNNILGQITGVTQGTQSRAYFYDLMGRMTSETNPESGSTNYAYDTATSTCTTAYPGQLVQKTDANNNTICYNYDLMGRMTSTTYFGPNAGPNLHFVYDVASYNGTAMTNAAGHVAEAYTCTTCTPTPTKITDEFFSYDARGSLTSVYESTPNSGGYYDTIAAYFPDYALETLVLPGKESPLAYTLDSKGRPYSATAASTTNLVTSTSYNPADKPLSAVLGLGDEDTFACDPFYRLTDFTYAVRASGLTDAGVLTYTGGTEANGTLSSLQITDGFNSAATATCNYGYDDMLRLNSANCGSAWAQAFSYDRYGNISKSGSLTCQPGYTPATNQYSSLQGATYDNNGNLTDDGINHYIYDANNFVVSVQTSGGTTNIIRDAFGRMVEIDEPSSVHREILYSATGKTAIMDGQSTIESTFASLPGGAELQALGGGSGGYLFHHKDWLARIIRERHYERQRAVQIGI
jgi:YD repeat-containing protein